ncbi:hypothetical protein ES703_26561 [subsurface metagenome]
MLSNWWGYVARCRRNQMMLKMVVATAMRTISSAHHGMPVSASAGAGAAGPAGVDFKVGWGDCSGSGDGGVGASVDTGAVYFTVPMDCSGGR